MVSVLPRLCDGRSGQVWRMLLASAPSNSWSPRLSQASSSAHILYSRGTGSRWSTVYLSRSPSLPWEQDTQRVHGGRMRDGGTHCHTDRLSARTSSTHSGSASSLSSAVGAAPF